MAALRSFIFLFSQLRITIVVSLVCIISAVMSQAEETRRNGSMFLEGHDGERVWNQTLATVRADWPVVHARPPVFFGTPPQPGLIESAWVEPHLSNESGVWPPRRQRVVVRVVPAPGGAWIDAVVQTQSLSGFEEGSLASRVGWHVDATPPSQEDITVKLVSQISPIDGSSYQLPMPEEQPLSAQALPLPPIDERPWIGSRHPHVSRAWHAVMSDYRNFYCCENLACLSAALGAGAIMANTGFDQTMQDAWMRGVAPTSLGKFFSGCNYICEGRYALPIFGAAYATGVAFENFPVGDAVGEWGGRSLRMFAVGAPPLYALQWFTGASRPKEEAGSAWRPFNDNNGVSGHAFVGAIPFLAAADMAESPLLKGTLYVCSTFVGFARMTENSHYPSQAFLGWYLAWASSRAVSQTEIQFVGLEVRVVPMPMADQGGLAVETHW